MTYKERQQKQQEIKKKLDALGVEKFCYYGLINNYGYTFIFNNIKYDFRHVLNVYGACVDMWDLYPSEKENDESKKNHLEDIKKLIIEYDNF